MDQVDDQLNRGTQMRGSEKRHVVKMLVRVQAVVADVCGGSYSFRVSGTIAMEPAASTSQTLGNETTIVILTKLEAMAREWEVINKILDHIGIPREQVSYSNTRQDEGRRSCELQGKNAPLYTSMNLEYRNVASSSQMGMVGGFS
ncbi:uncharacterized protein LOC124897056 [Capsicum annuum]|uniref:uncharacterized protein LOC124897056 n=1 Tax=Capsicum annuum TaxID=4072 RepID=UPI001FB122B9|nr:uncharacterized protein LOC124897056 [Capsicum annuum]